VFAQLVDGSMQFFEATRIRRAPTYVGIVTAALLCAGSSAWAQAAAGPAVSALNGKVSLAGGEMDAHPAVVGEGSVSFPLTYSFGGQIDLAGGEDHGTGLWGAAAQGFWRDPSKGLLGAVALHSSTNLAISNTANATARLNRYGSEAAAYLGAFTPEAMVGYQNGNGKTGAFGVLDLGWYPIDDLRLTGGVDLNPGHTDALLGAEYQLGLKQIPGLTTFVESAISGQRDSYALVGLRIYFGPAKTLIRRQREDDPESPIVSQGVEGSLSSVPSQPMPLPTTTTTSNSTQNSQGSNQNSGSQNGTAGVGGNSDDAGGSGSQIFTNNGGGFEGNFLVGTAGAPGAPGP
jgi:hypothetical protein